ncbi:MAG: DUF1501 domain-containing protein [Burkholderiaceae bacterium]
MKSSISNPSSAARRRWLGRTLGLSASAWLGARSTLGRAADQQAPRLLVVFLRGGYDATSLLVPYRSSFYYEARPAIAIKPPDSGDALAAVRLDDDWALHPALADSLLPLYRAGQLAFVPFAGTPDLSRSHFETQDSIELGLASSTDGSTARTGFLHRLADELDGGDRTAAFTEQPPLILRGTPALANIAVRGGAGKAFTDRQQDLIRSMYADQPQAAQIAQSFEVQKELADQAIGEMKGVNRQAINPRGFEMAARRVARLMRERYRIGFIDVGGWDTHVGQGAGTGYLADRFAELGRGLAAFADDAASIWPQTTVVVLSEFGRTFRENGNRGTDHGHGSVYCVLGGNVRGGRVLGEQLVLERSRLFQDRDLPVLNDYRSLFGGLFARLFELDRTRLARVFPDVPPRDIGLV